eukprot:scaffold90234_cov69-Phaeocystis_antarctica.AAC.7
MRSIASSFEDRLTSCSSPPSIDSTSEMRATPTYASESKCHGSTVAPTTGAAPAAPKLAEGAPIRSMCGTTGSPAMRPKCARSVGSFMRARIHGER